MNGLTLSGHHDAATGASESDGSAGQPSFAAQKRTARVAGLWYLALGVTGILGFLVIRQSLVSGDPAATLANLVDQPGLARIGVTLELALVVTQALTAVWFYKLFRMANATAAWALAIFGMVNAVAILAGVAFMATALEVAGDTTLAPGGDAAATVQLMFQLSSNSWGVGSLFFGLWLIPMGYIATTSGLMPRWLGRILVIGGIGYLLSTFVKYGVTDAPAWLVEGLPLPATVGEFWMIGYLLIKGVRRPEEIPAGTR